MNSNEPAEDIRPAVVLAMILCDNIHRDPATGKFFILGTYSFLGVADQFPWTHPIILVYVALTDGRGPVPLRLRLIDVDEENPPIFETEETIDFDDPIETIE